MLVENLEVARAGGEQRRVQTRLLRATRRQLATTGRAGRAIEAGYEPFEPSASWHWGYVEDPRFLHGRARLASALLALPAASALGAAAAGAWRLELLPAVALALVLLLGLFAVAHNALGRLAERHELGDLDHRSPESSAADPLRIFNSAMPPAALTAYRRARQAGLFDTFAVYSPRAEDFRTVTASKAPSLGLLDPVLVGLIGDQRFLVAQWDLAKDLS